MEHIPFLEFWNWCHHFSPQVSSHSTNLQRRCELQNYFHLCLLTLCFLFTNIRLSSWTQISYLTAPSGRCSFKMSYDQKFDGRLPKNYLSQNATYFLWKLVPIFCTKVQQFFGSFRLSMVTMKDNYMYLNSFAYILQISKHRMIS